MKKFLLLFVVGVSMMMATNASAQGYLKINPITLAFGRMGIQYEGVINEKSSYQVGAFFVSRSSTLLGYKKTGFGANLQYRFYLSSDDAPRGLFVAPAVGASFMNYSYDDDLLADYGFKYNVISVGGLIGYQWLFSDDRFSFELGIGPAYYIYTGDIREGAEVGGSVLPIASLSLGYRLVE